MYCWSLDICAVCKCIVRLNFKAQAPDTLCDTSDWGSNSIITEKDTGVCERKAADE